MSDWRLQGQERYLKGVVLERKLYRRYSPDWDHDHCEFCGAEFSEGDPATLQHGYATSDDHHWICDGCFGDFRALLEWQEPPRR